MYSKTGITPKKYKVQFKDRGSDWRETYKEDAALKKVRGWIRDQRKGLPERKFRIIEITETIIK